MDATQIMAQEAGVTLRKLTEGLYSAEGTWCQVTLSYRGHGDREQWVVRRTCWTGRCRTTRTVYRGAVLDHALNEIKEWHEKFSARERVER